MTRLVLFLVHNWPLKLAAVVLATLLYGFIVLTQDARQATVAVPIVQRNQSDAVARLSNLGEVTRVRYVTREDVPVNSSSFIAWVDLAESSTRPGTSSVRVHLQAIDDRIDIIDFEPQRISVTLEEVISRTVPVRAEQGPVPSGLEVRLPEVAIESAVVRGASSSVRQVDRVVARVQIEPSGLSFDRDVELIPVDALGNEVLEVEVTPGVAHVRVAVFSDRTTRSVPVSPVLTGQPAPGFELAAISVDPLLVTVEGDADQLVAVLRADTDPISISGATDTVDRTVRLALPPGVLAVDSAEVRVKITLRPVTATRTFSAGIDLTGEQSSLTYALSTDSVLATIGGSVADLDRLDGRSFDVEASVAGLGPGEHVVEITADLPAGLTLVTSSPPTVVVTISSRPATAPPSAGPDPTPSPSPSSLPSP